MAITYLIIVIFFTLTQFLENKIYTQKTRKLRQNTQSIDNFLCYYGKIHSKLPIFRVKSEKNLHLPEKFTLTASAASATIIWYAVVGMRYIYHAYIFFIFFSIFFHAF